MITDSFEYPVPDGVHTEKDGPVSGQDIDAYLQVEPQDPQAAMGALFGKEAFEIQESPDDCIFVPKEDCRGFCISIPSGEFMKYAKSVKGSPLSVLYVCFAGVMQRVHPENTRPINFMVPVNIRKVMGNADSLLHQVVHVNYSFTTGELLKRSDEELNTQFRAALSGFTGKEAIKKTAGVYRAVCESYSKAFVYGALNKIVMDQRKNMKAGAAVSYLGTLRAAEYGNRIRMTAFHAMQEKGIMLQAAEVGEYFYIDWYQGFHGEEYVLAMRDILAEKGISGIKVERIE